MLSAPMGVGKRDERLIFQSQAPCFVWGHFGGCAFFFSGDLFNPWYLCHGTAFSGKRSWNGSRCCQQSPCLFPGCLHSDASCRRLAWRPFREPLCHGGCSFDYRYSDSTDGLDYRRNLVDDNCGGSTILCRLFFPSGFAVLSKLGPAEYGNMAVSLCIPLAFLVGGGVMPTLIGMIGDVASISSGIILAGTAMILGGCFSFFVTFGKKCYS